MHHGRLRTVLLYRSEDEPDDSDVIEHDGNGGHVLEHFFHGDPLARSDVFDSCHHCSWVPAISMLMISDDKRSLDVSFDLDHEYHGTDVMDRMEVLKYLEYTVPW